MGEIEATHPFQGTLAVGLGAQLLADHALLGLIPGGDQVIGAGVGVLQVAPPGAVIAGDRDQADRTQVPGGADRAAIGADLVMALQVIVTLVLVA